MRSFAVALLGVFGLLVCGSGTLHAQNPNPVEQLKKRHEKQLEVQKEKQDLEMKVLEEKLTKEREKIGDDEEALKKFDKHEAVELQKLRLKHAQQKRDLVAQQTRAEDAASKREQRRQLLLQQQLAYQGALYQQQLYYNQLYLQAAQNQIILQQLAAQNAALRLYRCSQPRVYYTPQGVIVRP